MCDVQIFRPSVWDPETLNRALVHATHPHHLPVDGFPGCHLMVEPITVDPDGPEFDDALSVSFAYIVAPLRVRA